METAHRDEPVLDTEIRTHEVVEARLAALIAVPTRPWPLDLWEIEES